LAKKLYIWEERLHRFALSIKNIMKQYLLFYLFLFGIVEQGLAQISARKFTIQILRIYSPEHAFMLDKYYKTNSVVHLPSATINIGRHLDFMAYLTDTTHRDILIHEIPLMIHEIYHDYTRRGAYTFLEQNPEAFEPGKEYLLFYFDEKKELFSELISSFPANEIVKAIPNHLKEERFKMFIATNHQVMLPQKMGFMGLLDEWNAFCHQTLMAFETKEFYERESFQDAKHWEGFFSNYYDSYHAYPEFKYFILKYLQYAKYKHPKVYEQIMLNPAIKTIYSEIDKRYTQVIKDFEKYKPLVIQFLGKKGIQITEEEHNGHTILFIQGVGVDTYDRIFKLYKKALEDEELRTLDFQLKN
jgi:hypothetical protein